MGRGPISLLVFFSLLQSRRAVRSRLARSRDYLERDRYQSSDSLALNPCSLAPREHSALVLLFSPVQAFSLLFKREGRPGLEHLFLSPLVFMVDFSCSVFEHRIAMKETCVLVLQYYACCQSTILAGKPSKIEINVSRLRETGTPSKGKKRQKSEIMHKRQHCDTSHILDPINFLLKSHTYRSRNPFFTLLQAVHN